ncbi:MAG: pilus assembly FimT family protein [Gemmatimonadaceae bacterium]
MMRARGGVTLLEMSVVLVIIAIAATLVVPALVDLGQVTPHHTAASLLGLLRASRGVAIDSDVTVTLLVDPTTGDFRADSVGVGGMGAVATGALALAGDEALVTDLPRLRYVFAPTGATLADTVRVRGADSSLVVFVDPWSGMATAYAH